MNDYLKIVKIEEPKYKKFKNLIAEIEPENYRAIMSVGKLNVRWNRCNVYDAINVRRCFNCQLFNHIGKDCQKDPVCLFCAKNHKVQHCRSKESAVKCINCVRANEKLQLNLNVKHPASSLECPVFLRNVEMKKKSIKYE
jgi:hypothetical protein